MPAHPSTDRALRRRRAAALLRVADAAAERYSAAPTLNFALSIERAGGGPVRSILLDTQIQIAARRRPYGEAEQTQLVELFGTPERWGTTLRTLLWTRTTLVVPPFSDSDRDHRCRSRAPTTSRPTPRATCRRWRTARCRSSSSSPARSSTRAPAGCCRPRASPGSERPSTGCPWASGARRWTATSPARRGCASGARRSTACAPTRPSTGCARSRTPWSACWSRQR